MCLTYAQCLQSLLRIDVSHSKFDSLQAYLHSEFSPITFFPLKRQSSHPSGCQQIVCVPYINLTFHMVYSSVSVGIQSQMTVI